MKKVISLVMALVMMMAVMVPVFAGTLNAATPAGEVQVKTDINAITGDGTYSVTIPTAMPIVWNTTSTSFEYSVTSTLKSGKAVNVVVSQKNAEMTAIDADVTDSIEYSLAGKVNATTSKPSVSNEKFNFSVEVAQSEFDAATIAEYADTVTFTATIVNA